MASDRGAVLTIQAAVEGLIDFRKSRILDHRWWRRCRVLIEALDRKTHGQGIDAAYRFDLALMANSGLTEDSFERSQASAKERFYDLMGTYRPWEGKSYLDRRQSDFRDVRQAYIDSFGVDPLDPLFKEWETEQIRRMEAGELGDEVAEDSEEALNRRLRERILQKG